MGVNQLQCNYKKKPTSVSQTMHNPLQDSTVYPQSIKNWTQLARRLTKKIKIITLEPIKVDLASSSTKNHSFLYHRFRN